MTEQPHKPEPPSLEAEVRAALTELAREAPAPPSAEAVFARVRESRLRRPLARPLLAAAAALALTAAAVSLAWLTVVDNERRAQPAFERADNLRLVPREDRTDKPGASEEAAPEPREAEQADMPVTARVEPIAPDATSTHAMDALTRWMESTGARAAVVDAHPGRPVALALCDAEPHPERDYDAELRTLLAHYNVVELRYEAGRLTGTLGRIRTEPQP